MRFFIKIVADYSPNIIRPVGEYFVIDVNGIGGTLSCDVIYIKV